MRARAMRPLIPIWRGLRVLLHLLTGAALLAIPMALPRALGHRPGWVSALTCWWYRRLCRILRIRVEAVGALAPRILLVANHVSWLDIPVLGAQGDIAFLSKAEIRAWPLIGWMSAVTGTLFIHRGAHQAREMADQIHPEIRVQVRFLPAIESAGLDRKAMAATCRRAIGEALELRDRAP